MVREIVAKVVDPELRVVTIEELGILRDVSEDPESGAVTVTITPTYSGCPAMDVIRDDIRGALAAAGHAGAEVRTVLHPAWSTDMITVEGRRKLAAAGIAPPPPATLAEPADEARPAGRGPVPLRLAARCTRCGSPDTEEISHFGSTACKALWRCRACGEPFDLVKPL
jgi:ring-1,2-phenylacetyl-CoA epoxidase subunit PaaD